MIAIPATADSGHLPVGTLHIPSSYSWRIPCYLQLMGPILVFVATLGCPESPRWLIHKGRKQEALLVLAASHANRLIDDALVQHEYREIEAALAEDRSAGADSSYGDFFKTKANRRRLLIILVIGVGTNWVGNGIINYYLTPTLHQVGITASAQISGINAGLQMWNLIISSSAALLVERLGRRFLWLFSDCGMLFSYIFAMGLSGEYATNRHAAVGIAVIPFLFLFFGAYDVAWTPLQYS